jgi:hypothetical protein
MGRDKTLKRVLRHFWWPGVAADVAAFVKTCHSCQRVKPSTQKRPGLLQPLPVPPRVWSSISMDFITDLPLTEAGYNAIFTVVCRLSKAVKLLPCRTDITAEQTADLFCSRVVAEEGLPSDIVSDRDPRFTSKFWAALCSRLGIQRSMSSAFHPQTDGNTERVNRVLEDMLRHYVSPSQTDWDTHLPMVAFAINTAPHASTQVTPFELTRGRKVLTPMEYALLRTTGRVPEHIRQPVSDGPEVPAATKFARDLQVRVQAARECLRAAQSRQKAVADRRRRHVQFAVGEQVLLSTANINFKGDLTPKLLPRYVGPFRVIDAIGKVAYKLELPPTLPVHPVFHVSLLKPYHDGGRVQPPPPPIDVDGEYEYEVEQILAHRKGKGRRSKPQFLVRWRGQGAEHDSWEPEQNMANCADKLREYWATVERVAHVAADVAAVRKARRSSKRPAAAVSDVGARRVRQRRRSGDVT